ADTTADRPLAGAARIEREPHSGSNLVPAPEEILGTGRPWIAAVQDSNWGIRKALRFRAGHVPRQVRTVDPPWPEARLPTEPQIQGELFGCAEIVFCVHADHMPPHLNHRTEVGLGIRLCPPDQEICGPEASEPTVECKRSKFLLPDDQRVIDAP